MKRNLLSIVAVLAISLGVNAQVQNYTVGQTVADFTVTDVHGGTHTLSSITGSGKWVILDFFFTACPPCQATVPFFSELHEKYGCNAGDVYMLSIDTGDSDADVLAFESTYSTSSGHTPAPAASGNDGNGNAVVTAFGISAFPTYCLIGPDMKLKNGDIWPVSSIAQFESAFSSAGFNPTVMSCAGAIDEDMVTFNAFNVYPNPATTSATIGVNLVSSTEVVANVYNTVGALVATEMYNGVEGDNNFVLNTSDLENGQYILKVTFGNGTETQLSMNVMK